jgi:hypothetical protein
VELASEAPPRFHVTDRFLSLRNSHSDAATSTCSSSAPMRERSRIGQLRFRVECTHGCFPRAAAIVPKPLFERDVFPFFSSFQDCSSPLTIQIGRRNISDPFVTRRALRQFLRVHGFHRVYKRTVKRLLLRSISGYQPVMRTRMAVKRVPPFASTQNQSLYQCSIMLCMPHSPSIYGRNVF